MIKELLEWAWNQIPWFIKWPVVVVVGPNLTVMAFVFFVFGVPWVTKTIHATIRPYEERRDAEFKGMVELQRSMDRKLDIIIQQGRK